MRAWPASSARHSRPRGSPRCGERRTACRAPWPGSSWNLSSLDADTLALLRRTPARLSGSCRYRLSDEEVNRLVRLFARHDVRYFIYIGGNDSGKPAHRLACVAGARGYELAVTCVPDDR